MRFVRFISNGKVLEGSDEDGILVERGGKSHVAAEVVWLPPVIPSKIIGLVLNYRDHADELGLSVSEDPVIFLKPPSSLIGNYGDIVYPSGVKYMHYEGELAVVIGKQARKVSSKKAMDFVKGFTIANDVTVRDYISNTFRPPVKAKGFDTFCPVGPSVVTQDESGDISNLNIRTRVNGELCQEGNTRSLIHNIPKLIEFLSDFMTLLPDDLILTGTPKGISPVHPGDKIEVEIDNLGTLTNIVVPELENTR
ncbi:MAG TPA: fumarylacetoacetate hydrolase family protein [Nitrososphaerales archaeon]|nr:fumarylacetoacetate hydrolase family protein [Nitrososphaerales archaeon]